MAATSAQAAVLQPALRRALHTLLAAASPLAAQLPAARETNELLLASIVCAAGRALLCAPSVFEAALTATAAELQLPSALPAFASRWLACSDSVLLSTQRKSY